MPENGKSIQIVESQNTKFTREESKKMTIFFFFFFFSDIDLFFA